LPKYSTASTSFNSYLYGVKPDSYFIQMQK